MAINSKHEPFKFQTNKNSRSICSAAPRRSDPPPAKCQLPFPSLMAPPRTRSNLHQRATAGVVAPRTTSNLHHQRATATGVVAPRTTSNLPPRGAPAAGDDASGEPHKPTTSRSAAESETAAHDFVVVGYSKLKALGVGQYVSSDAFRAGGHDWKIRFYPKLAQVEGGIADYTAPQFPGGASLHLCDAGEDTELTVRFTLSVLERDGGESPLATRTATEIFGAPPRRVQRHGFHRLVVGSMLKPARCIHNDVLTIRCALTVFKATEPVPRPELAAHLGGLLGTGMGADITIQVGGRAFRAHRIILAARSPFFGALLFGDMAEKGATCIEVDDVRPEVFELLLQYIYTERLPGDGEGCDAATMQHLLVAADWYGLDRLKQICEGKLHARVDEETAASMFALAERHNCPRLRDACRLHAVLPIDPIPQTSSILNVPDDSKSAQEQKNILVRNSLM